MIIGNGSIASMLNDREGFVLFAAGISNSQITASDHDSLHREISMLKEACKKKSMLIYFSSISIFLTDSLYVRHKRNMERLIKDYAANYTILRLGNIWECTNPNTFINAYKTKPYEPRDEYKYMISKQQLNFITDNLPTTGKHEISIFGEMILVKDALKK